MIQWLQFEGNHNAKHNKMYKVVMEHLQNLENHDRNMDNGNEDILLKKALKTFKSNKCNQCDFASSWASTLKTLENAHCRQI